MDEFRKNLENSFEELGVSYDNAVLEKCIEICKKYDVTEAEDFVDTWMAYSVSHIQGENPTISNLAKFEREEFAKKSKDVIKAPQIHKKSLTIYEANQDMDVDEVSSIMMAYNETTPRRNLGKNEGTPEGSGVKRGRNYSSSPQVVFSPASFSPSIATPSSKYVSRTNSGDVVMKFNDNESNRAWKAQENYLARVELNSKSNIQHYMSYDLVDCLDYVNNSIEKLGNLIRDKYSFDEVMPVRYKHPSPFITVGKISCDSDGRLNSKSVLLEGSTESSFGKSVYLDLSTLQKYSLFPGQVVAVEGHNLTDDKLIVKEIYCDVSPNLARPYELARGALNIMVAAGPYTQSDSMTYQPLLDLINVAVNNEPHALILTGPLIDSSHPVILENTMAESFEDFFGKLIDKIMKPLEKKKTQVIIVNSTKDCNAHCVYPTPQLSLKARFYAKLHLLSDPSIFTLEDLVIGITSTDILLHLSKEEISCSPHSAGRLTRLAAHLLQQRSFYPLYPATEIPLDPTLMDFAKLDIVPHLLILPSDLRYFIKDVCGSVVVNPERLAKGVIGGTYARLIDQAPILSLSHLYLPFPVTHIVTVVSPSEARMTPSLDATIFAASMASTKKRELKKSIDIQSELDGVVCFHIQLRGPFDLSDLPRKTRAQ